MSHHSVGGRDGRQNVSSSRSVGSVTVKTLPNSQSLSSSSHHQNKRLFTKEKVTDRDNGAKLVREPNNLFTRPKNGEADIPTKPKILAPRAKVQSSNTNSSSSAISESYSTNNKSMSTVSGNSTTSTTPRLANSTTKGRNPDRSGAPASIRVADRKPSISEDREIEVRSNHSSRDNARGGKSSSGPSRSYRGESRNHYGAPNSYSVPSRGSGRIFTSEKFRNSNNHHVMENDMAGWCHSCFALLSN